MSSFKSVLAKNHSFTIHEKDLQELSAEAFKVKMCLSPIILKEIFQYTENAVLRVDNHLRRANIRTVRFSSESTANLGTKIFIMIPEEIKTSNTLHSFKSKIKKVVSSILFLQTLQDLC